MKCADEAVLLLKNVNDNVLCTLDKTADLMTGERVWSALVKTLPLGNTGVKLKNIAKVSEKKYAICKEKCG